jgi:hypothetical protein
LDFRKNKIIYKFKEFSKFFKEHCKKDRGHFETQVILDKVLSPFHKLMDTNARLALLEFHNPSEQKLNSKLFLYSADIHGFVVALQEAMAILQRHTDIMPNPPNVYASLKKFQYREWEQNAIERFLIQPLLDSWSKMRANLFKLFTMGPNFWKQPLAEN